MPLTLSCALTPSRFRLRSLNDPVAWRQTNLELDNLVPYGVGALMVGNRQKLAQTATRVRRLRFVAYGLRHWRIVGRGFVGKLFDRLFFTHKRIIS